MTSIGNTHKRIICALTALTFAFSASTASSFEETGTPFHALTANAEDIVKENEFQKHEFQFLSKDNSGYNVNFTDSFYYSDSYFSGDPFQYDPSLASASLALAMASFRTAGTAYSEQSRNARQFLKAIGISEDMIDVNKDFREEPLQDTIGVIVGSKKIASETEGEDIDLLVVGLRGSGYTHEWSGNFNAGTEGDHAGFGHCSEEVLKTIREYISKHGITGRIKLWITGFSRGAASANIAAGKLDNGASLGEGIELDKSDIYAYCFETPSGTLGENSSEPYLSSSYENNAGRYGNIHNIINPCDPVVYVPPLCLGFGRYGDEVYIPTRSNTAPAEYEKALKNMLSLFPADKASPYIIESFCEKRLTIPDGENSVITDVKFGRTQDEFLSDFFDMISKNLLVSREYYTENYQDTVRKTIDLFLSAPSAQLEDTLNGFADELKSYILGNIAGSSRILPLLGIYNTNPNLVLPYLINSLQKNQAFDAGSALKRSMDKAGMSYEGVMNDNDFAVFGKVFDKLLSLDPAALLTLLSNVSSIGQGHYPIVCWSWVKSMDPNYSEDPTPVPLSCGDYYRLTVNNSADIRVYDKNGMLSATIVKEQPKSVDGGIVSYIDVNMQKTVIIPKGFGYRAEISPSDDSSINIQVLEYCAGTNGIVKNTDYFDLPVRNYGTLSLSFDENDENRSAKVILKKSDGSIVSADTVLEGAEEAGRGKDLVLGSSNNGGVIVGGGNYQYGSFVSIAAVASDGYRFAGWYNGNDPVTTDKYGRICVKDDAALTADFARILSRAARITAKVETPLGKDLDKVRITIYDEKGSRLHTGNADNGSFYAEVTGAGSRCRALFEIPGYAPREVTFEIKNNRYDIGSILLCLYGDVNADGRVNFNDLGIIQQKLCDWDVEFAYDAAADVDLGGTVDLQDLGLMQQYLADWDVVLGKKPA